MQGFGPCDPGSNPGGAIGFEPRFDPVGTSGEAILAGLLESGFDGSVIKR